MTIEVHDHELPVSPARWARTLSELSDVLLDTLLRRGHARDKAMADSQAIVLELSHYFGGRALYVPKGKAIRIALRDSEIFARANGLNATELASRFDLTVRRVQQIVVEQRDLRRAQRATGKDALS